MGDTAIEVWPAMISMQDFAYLLRSSAMHPRPKVTREASTVKAPSPPRAGA